MKISRDLDKRLKEKGTFDDFVREYKAIHDGNFPHIQPNPTYANTFAGMLEIARGLNDENEDYLIIGGLAVASYLHQANEDSFRKWRGTSDIDLIVPNKDIAEKILLRSRYEFRQTQPTKEGMIGRLFDYAKEDNGETTVVGYRQGICDKNGKNITKKLITHSAIIPVHGIRVAVPQLRDLVKMKKWANRKKDRGDIKTLRQMLD